MSRLRTFIAIELNRHVRDQILALQESLARVAIDVKWVEEGNLHVTLLFLGEVEDRQLPAVCKAVAERAANHQPFGMTVEKLSCFGNPRRPRTVWVGVGEGAERVIALHDDIEEGLFQLGGYRREERQYTPHITLGRVKRDGGGDALATMLAKKSDWHGGDVQVTEVRVMSSELTPDGPLYTVLGRAPLSEPRP